MQHRLEDHNIPAVTLPDWVLDPGRFKFPIDEKALRKWNPLRAAAMAHKEGQESDESTI